jgi:hypothetical protein
LVRGNLPFPPRPLPKLIGRRPAYEHYATAG